MVSVIIPFKNDDSLIFDVVNSLCEGLDTNIFEIIVVNDGSVHGSGKFKPLVIDRPNVRVVNNAMSLGVGYSFDSGVRVAQGDIIVLMGSDVFVRRITWLNDVINAVNSNPNTLGCSVCIGLNPSRMDLDHEKSFRRYGAELLFTVSADDIPPESDLRKRRDGYSDLFKAKWMTEKKQDTPYEIPCLLGAFYFTSKEYYNKLNGWDTKEGVRYCGHRYWGHLEPYISLKSWLVGGGCTLYPEIEAGHVFARVDKGNVYGKGLRSADWMWWNALFILETQIIDDDLRRRLYEFPFGELNLNVAKHWIKQYYGYVVAVREMNRQKFKNTPKVFEDKFGYKIKV